MTGLSWLLPAIACLMAAEIGVMALRRRPHLMPTMLAGFFLVLAWNAAVQTVGATVILPLLAAALIAHGIDLVKRW